MVGLIGPNGAGKSTLLHLMNGLLKPASGHARIQGEDAAPMDPVTRARKVAFVPQASRVSFPFTAGEIAAMGRRPHLGSFGDLTPEDKEHVAWAMESTGTTPLAHRLFNQLSGGEAQRVVLARALAQDAPALLLDEPTASLDLYYQAALYGLLERLNRERGLTVVIVTHEINLAAEYCPRLIGIREGRIWMDGPPEEIVTPEKILELYGVQAEIIASGGGRMVRVRHQMKSEL
jgi:iron complex transport system ATP-binding protein